MKLHSLKQNKALTIAAVNPDEIKKSLRTKSLLKGGNGDINPAIAGLLRPLKAKHPALKKTKTSLSESGEESRFLAENISELLSVLKLIIWPVMLIKKIAIMIYRIMHEQLNNISKYAHR